MHPGKQQLEVGVLGWTVLPQLLFPELTGAPQIQSVTHLTSIHPVKLLN